MSAVHGGADGDRKRNKKRALVVIAGLVAASGVGSLAFAYWTESGSQTQNAQNDTTKNLTITPADISTTLLYPGASVALSGTVDNGNSSAITLVTGVNASVTDVTDATGTSIASTCLPSWYTVTGGPVAAGTSVAGGGSAPFSALTLHFNDSNTNQDACKGATPVITYTAS
jgi:hypothetical protein